MNPLRCHVQRFGYKHWTLIPETRFEFRHRLSLCCPTDLRYRASIISLGSGSFAGSLRLSLLQHQYGELGFAFHGGCVASMVGTALPSVVSGSDTGTPSSELSNIW